MAEFGLTTIGTILFLLLQTVSCSSQTDNMTITSTSDRKNSHNHGQNCLRCHSVHGKGKGQFTLAGSLFSYNQREPFPGGFIRLYSEDLQQGNLILELPVDRVGNFYTTVPIDFSRPLYAVAFNDSGRFNEMNIPLSNGACNTCHNHAPGRIWVL